MLQSFMYLHTTDFLPICTHFHTHTHTHAHPLTCTCTPPHKHMHTSHIHMPPPHICHHPLTYTCTPLTYICHHPFTYTCTPPHIYIRIRMHAYTHTNKMLHSYFFPLSFPSLNRLLSNLPQCHCCSQDPYRLALPGSQARSGEITFGCH